MNQKFRKTALLMGTMAFLELGYSSNAYAAESPQEVQQATKKITGTVVDAQGPVIGASVVEKGKSGNGVITDFDGKFTPMLTQALRSLSRTSVMKHRKSRLAISHLSTLP